LANRRAADLYAYKIAPIIAELNASGIVLPRAIADELSKRQVRTAKGNMALHDRRTPARPSTLNQTAPPSSADVASQPNRRGSSR
jgi:hypothetical protein